MIKNHAKTSEATKVTAPSRPPLLTITDQQFGVMKPALLAHGAYIDAYGGMSVKEEALVKICQQGKVDSGDLVH